jgi:hypothetical protein
MPEDRIGPLLPMEKLAGTPENLNKLLELLDPWKCCGSPSACGVWCRDSELNWVLAEAHRVITDYKTPKPSDRPTETEGTA